MPTMPRRRPSVPLRVRVDALPLLPAAPKGSPMTDEFNVHQISPRMLIVTDDQDDTHIVVFDPVTGRLRCRSTGCKQSQDDPDLHCRHVRAVLAVTRPRRVTR